jgi:hypothetical protein
MVVIWRCAMTPGRPSFLPVSVLALFSQVLRIEVPTFDSNCRASDIGHQALCDVSS